MDKAGKKKGKTLAEVLFHLSGNLNRMEYGWIYFLVLTLYLLSLFSFKTASDSFDVFTAATSAAFFLLAIPVMKRYRSALSVRYAPEAIGIFLATIVFYLGAVAAEILPPCPIVAQTGAAIALSILFAGLVLPPKNMDKENPSNS